MTFEKIYSEFLVESLKSQQNALRCITKILASADIDFVFIGGAILPIYNYSRFTEDVDILVNSNHKNRVLALPIGVVKVSDSGRSAVFNTCKTKADILYSGDFIGSQRSGRQFARPMDILTVDDGIPVLPLRWLVMYKIISGLYGDDRLVDFGDVQRLISKNNLPRDFVARCFSSDDVQKKYENIWDVTVEK